MGRQLNIDQSILTDIKSKGHSNEQMKYLLEEWSIKGGVLSQLEDALFHLDMKDVIPGMLYYNASLVLTIEHIIL